MLRSSEARNCTHSCRDKAYIFVWSFPPPSISLLLPLFSPHPTPPHLLLLVWTSTLCQPVLLVWIRRKFRHMSHLGSLGATAKEKFCWVTSKVYSRHALPLTFADRSASVLFLQALSPAKCPLSQTMQLSLLLSCPPLSFIPEWLPHGFSLTIPVRLRFCNPALFGK